MVASRGIEPRTRGFSVRCSTNWANWPDKTAHFTLFFQKRKHSNIQRLIFFKLLNNNPNAENAGNAKATPLNTYHIVESFEVILKKIFRLPWIIFCALKNPKYRAPARAQRSAKTLQCRIQKTLGCPARARRFGSRFWRIGKIISGKIPTA